MDKNNPSKGKEIKDSSFEQRKKRNSSNPSHSHEKKLPWWVELLFVQIGLPDNWLITLLKLKKRTKDLYKNERRLITYIILLLLALGYFQPVIKNSRNKLSCQKVAKDYILDNFNINKSSRTKLKMIAVNFCDGGLEIDKLERVK